MKTRTMNVLTPLAALAFAFGAQAFQAQTEGFESITAGQGVGAAQKFVYVPPTGENVTDASVVTAYDNDAPAQAQLPGGFDSFGSNYLKLSTEDGTLLRSINALNNGDIGEAAEVKGDGITVDAVMQFTVTDSADRPEPGANDKFTLWLEKDSNNNVNLMACGGKFDYDGETSLQLNGSAIYKLNANVTAGSWHRVTIKAIANANTGKAVAIPAFEIAIDGTTCTATRVKRAGEESEGGIFTDENNDRNSGDVVVSDLGTQPIRYIPSLSASATLQAVGFAGEGKLDDLSITDDSLINFTITAPENTIVDTTALPQGVTYDNGTFVAEGADDYVFTFKAADGKLFADGSKTTTKTVSVASGTAEYEPTLDQNVVDAIASFANGATTNEYLTIGAAYTVATNAHGGTITLLKDTTSGTLKWAANNLTSALVFDLGGHTLTASCGASDKYFVQITKGTPTVTFQNGKIKADASYEGKALTTVFQNYANLVVENVEIDADYFDGTTNPYTDKPGMIFAVMNGSLAITGNTSVTNCHGWVLSVGNHAGKNTDYPTRAVTLNTTGTLDGDFRLCGGTVTYVQCDFSDDAKFYYGAAHNKGTDGSVYTDGDLVNFPFVARAGGEAVMPVAEASYNYAGQFYLTADDAFAAVDGETTVGIIADCEFSGSYVFTNDVTITVASNVTLTRAGSTTYPFTIKNDATLTFNGDGTIYKAAGCGSSTMVSVGEDDNFAIDSGKAGHVVIADCGIKLIDLGGSNTISIDCGSLVMNGGYVENGNAAGHAVRVSSVITDGTAALITVNKGQLKAVASPIGVKTKTGGATTITQLENGWARINYDNDSGNHYAGKIWVALDAGEDLLFSNTLSEFAPVGYQYVASATDGWYKIGIRTYTVTVTDGASASGTALPASFLVTDTYPLAITLTQPTAPEGKQFASWSANYGTIVDGTLTLATFPNADVVVTVVWENISSGTNPGETTGTEYDTELEAQTAAASVTVAATDAVKAALTTAGASESDYLAMFTGKAVPAGEGKYTVEVCLTAAAETALQTQANNAAVASAAEVADAADEAQTVSITTTPGFYYSVKFGTSLDNMSEGDRTLATGTSLDITLPKGGTAGFYSILINVAPKAAPAK